MFASSQKKCAMAARSSAQARFEEIVRSTSWLMSALKAARSVGAPDWLIGAGAVRTAVWDRLHGYDTRSRLADIDLVFFDLDGLSEERERQIELLLESALPGERWDAKNQAAVHLWYPEKFGHEVDPLASSAAAVATWPETAVCVGVRLTEDDQLLSETPLGLDDLMSLIHRRNPARVTIEEYERRLLSKRITERWPHVTVIPERPGITCAADRGPSNHS